MEGRRLMATHTDESRIFEPTWSAFKPEVNLDNIDTDVWRIGWPKPTIYREHEVIHLLCNLLDKALAAVKEKSDG